MFNSPHIAVLGAGLIGVSVADSLLRRGAGVTLVEARGAPMRGASFANSGMIHPSQACSWAGVANDPD
ncbi:MAG: FAD-dependent oxidoreductase, partial [Litorimonas sp.]